MGIARHLAYAPDEIGAVERQLAETRERLAREERERQERIAQEVRERQAHIAVANAASSTTAAAAIESSLDWDYSYNKVYVPAAYETRLRESGIWFKEYSLETSQKYAGFTSSTLEKVYFSVRLRNPASHAVQVTYKIKAREQFSVGKALGNTTKAGFWGVMVGIALLALLETRTLVSQWVRWREV